MYHFLADLPCAAPMQTDVDNLPKGGAGGYIGCDGGGRGLKTIINALLHSFKQLAEVMTLTIFCLMVFALFALQVYMGELRNKCVRDLQLAPGDNFTDELWLQWIREPSNWILNADEIPIICGNLTGARHCPPRYTCLCVGPNPNHGYTNFDNFLWSMLTTFQLITLDYWENVYNMLSAPSFIRVDTERVPPSFTSADRAANPDLVTVSILVPILFLISFLVTLLIRTPLSVTVSICMKPWKILSK
ncbi:Sodium channel protein 60E [Eumeta japonica]|uniref:Sodium channel protein 60E n=1 Tax=Eumeta variegata TaxID=151549 RepID=A0A4C1TTX5_EUMVA|nr:Sodium channel protein 60E [Eumeta japonica]